MAIDVTTILAQIAKIEVEIINPVSGHPLKAYQNIPETTSVANMPCFINFPGRLLENTLMGSEGNARDFKEVREYQLVFYLAAFGTGVDQEKTGLLTPYFELIMAKFASYPHLKATAGVMDSLLMTDTGSTAVIFNQQPYYGIRSILRVTGRVRRILAAGE